MSKLKIFDAQTANLLCESENFEDIKANLEKVGIDFQRWQSLFEKLGGKQDKHSLSNEEILDIYKPEIIRLRAQSGYRGVDIINIQQDFAQKPEFEERREQFLEEHTHIDDEIRYFIDGRGLFSIHKESKVYSVLCEEGDFISVPADIKHWFDMGSEPNFKCIRFFADQSGWQANYEPESISSKFPLLEDF